MKKKKKKRKQKKKKEIIKNIYLKEKEEQYFKEKQARLTYIIIQSNFKDEEKNIKDNNYSERKIYKFKIWK